MITDEDKEMIKGILIMLWLPLLSGLLAFIICYFFGV